LGNNFFNMRQVEKGGCIWQLAKIAVMHQHDTLTKQQVIQYKLAPNLSQLPSNGL
jgi:hypothetical protein